MPSKKLLFRDAQVLLNRSEGVSVELTFRTPEGVHRLTGGPSTMFHMLNSWFVDKSSRGRVYADEVDYRLDPLLSDKSEPATGRPWSQFMPVYVGKVLRGRVRNILDHAGVRTIEEVAQYFWTVIFHNRACGAKTIAVLRDMVKAAGMTFVRDHPVAPAISYPSPDGPIPVGL